MSNQKKNSSGLAVRHRDLVFIVLVLLSVALCGCSGKSAKKYTVFHVTGSSDLNNGKPVGLVILKTTQKDFLVKGYDEIVDMVYAAPKDESMLAWQMILPGEKQKIKVEQPGRGNVGIYSLYTNPDGNWKVMLNSPIDKNYEVFINKNSLETKKIGFSFWPF